MKTGDYREVSQSSARRIRRETMADNQLNEVTWDLVSSFRDTNQAVANNIVAVQELNMKFAQSLFLNGMEVYKNRVDITRSLMEEFGKQSQKQQDAFLRLGNASLNSYMDFFRTPLSYWRQMLDAAESSAKRGIEYTQRAARQRMEAAEGVSGGE
jgi:hypothetical protein